MKIRSFSSAKAYAKLEGFLQQYAGKNARVDELTKICNRHFREKADLQLWARLAFVYLQLNRKDQNILIANQKWIQKVNQACSKILSIETFPAFPPLFAQAKLIGMVEARRESISCLTWQSKMDPLYPTLFLSLNRSDDARILFNSTIENRFLLPLSETIPQEIYSFPIDVAASPLAATPDSIFKERIQVSCTTTHPLCSKMGDREDPCADTCAFSFRKLEDKQISLLALADGSGQGMEVVDIARLITRLFIEAMQQHIDAHLERLPEALLSSAFHAEQRLRELTTSNHSATFASTICISNPNGSSYGALLRLGDTCFFILYETKRELFVEEVDPLPIEKLASANGGAFSRYADYSSLSVATFQIPENAERAYLLLGSDGLSDNLDPRNALQNRLSEKIEEILGNEEHHHKEHNYTLENGTQINLDDAISSARDQKNLELLAATHLYPTPESLVQSLKKSPLNTRLAHKLDRLSSELPSSWREGNSSTLNQLIQIYKIHKIGQLFLQNRDELALSLLQHARRNGKPDDCIVAAIRIK